MRLPRVTVLMPAYNAAKYIGEAIESILAQTFSDFEFVIINDGSTDETERIILSFADPRINYIKNAENIKLIATLNKGVALAKGEYIVRMDADDISLPQRIEKQVVFMDQNPDVAVCGTWVQSFGAESKIVKYEAGHQEIVFKMLYQTQFVHPSVIMRTSLIRMMYPLFDPVFLHAEDYELFIRIGYQFRLANIREILLKYRIHPGSVSKEYSDIQETNSNIIRHAEFTRLGYAVSKQLLSDFTELNHHAQEKVKSSPKQIKELLEGMLTANLKTNCFTQKFLEEKLAYIWFHYCYKLASPAVFYSSEMLCGHIRPTVPQIIKWRFKSTFYPK